MSLRTVDVIIRPSCTPREKIVHGTLCTIGAALFAIGVIALLAQEGVVSGFNAVGVRGGLICIFAGLSLTLLETYLLSGKKERVYREPLKNRPLIEPASAFFCGIKRFIAGKTSERNPLWDTPQNMGYMYQGGFAKYPPLPEQLPELYNPSPVTPMTDKVRIRWMGHASFLIEVAVSEDKVVTILTDPNWSDTVPFIGSIPLYYRSIPPGLPFDEVPQVDAVLLSHTHRDHFDPPTLAQFEERDHPQVCCPKNAGRLLQGFSQVTELSWWETTVLEGGITITSVPSNHASQTTAFDCNEYLWGGYVISIPLDDGENYHIYHMGDSACNMDPTIPGFRAELWDYDSQIFDNIEERFPEIDLMLYQTDPVKGQEDKHCNVEQGIGLMQKLKPKKVIPMHWGTWPFNLFGRDLLAPVRILRDAIEETDQDLLNKFHQLKVGECVTLVEHQ